jgi:pyruvate/2-oxoglutarate/acetoin dehydrogenase E1 component
MKTKEKNHKKTKNKEFILMNYQQAIKKEMEKLSRDKKVVFLGYNIVNGSQAYGTLKDVPKEKCIEMPVAENLMVGMAIGMALEGLKPVIFFERHDFMLIALDALLNHADKIENMSKGQFKCPMIIRAPVGGTQPLNPGPQHTQDFTRIFKQMFHFPVYCIKSIKDVEKYYKIAEKFQQPVMLIEYKDLYSKKDRHIKKWQKKNLRKSR